MIVIHDNGSVLISVLMKPKVGSFLGNLFFLLKFKCVEEQPED